MPLYTVLAPPRPSASVEPDPVAYVFVKDGFCWPCLFFPAIWILFRRLWLVLLLYVIAGAIIAAGASGIGGPLPPLFILFAHFLFALEGNNLRRWTLRRRGYDLVGVATGRRVAEAEIRYFHDVEAQRGNPRMTPTSRLRTLLAPLRGPSAESGEVVGLFPSPGKAP